MTEKGDYQRYSPEFKREAVRQLTDSGKTTSVFSEVAVGISYLGQTS